MVEGLGTADGPIPSGLPAVGDRLLREMCPSLGITLNKIELVDRS